MYRYKDTVIELFVGDITEFKTDAIVNAANNSLLGGSGVDGAIHRVGGELILDQCKKIGGCPTGEARLTTAGNLLSKYVIHTVGPIYNSYKDKSIAMKLLFNAYYNSMKLADEYGLNSISFPSISTGAYGYPIEEAVEVAVNGVISYLKVNKNIEVVNFVLFSKDDYRIYLSFMENNELGLLTD